jgi:hypothetical protein
MMVGAGSRLGYIKNNDMKATTILSKVEGEEKELEEDWSAIPFD